jgi:hypothetical protein
VPEEVANELGITDAGIPIARVHGQTLQQLNNAMNDVARMTPPFDVVLSGEVGYVDRYDVVWVMRTPDLLGFHRKLCERLGIEVEGFKPFIPLGEVGKTSAVFQLDFGNAWRVESLRLCARYSGKDDCKIYPFAS